MGGILVLQCRARKKTKFSGASSNVIKKSKHT